MTLHVFLVFNEYTLVTTCFGFFLHINRFSLIYSTRYASTSNQEQLRNVNVALLQTFKSLWHLYFVQNTRDRVQKSFAGREPVDCLGEADIWLVKAKRLDGGATSAEVSVSASVYVT